MHEKVKKILVVEDESIIGIHLRSSLIQLGYKVLALVTSGEEAIQQVGAMMPDLILMDIKLAGDLDGIQTTERIRSRYDLPVVYLTAHSDTHLLERARMTDPFGYLIKPFHEKELRAAIEIAIYKHRIERTLKNTNQQLEQEIQERRQVEETLKVSETRYRELFDNMKSGVAVYETIEQGKDFIFKDFNRAGERIDHVKKQDLLGKSVLEAFPSVQDVNLFTTFQRVWRTGEPESHPISLYQDQRIVGWRENYVYKLPSGEIVAMYADVTEQKQAEQELEKHRDHLEELVQERTGELKVLANRFRTAIETVGEGITLSNDNGYFEIFNSKIEEITGYTKQEANQSSNFLRLLYPGLEEYHQTLAGLQEIREQGGTRDIETIITTKQGARKTLLVSTSIIHDQQRIWYLSAYRDITDRKCAEVELQRAKEAAELANRTKSQFIANMSHELRTPLNAILGYAQIFKTAENLTQRQIEGLETIKNSGEHLLHLINEVLDLSKVEAGKFKLQRKDFHLPDFLTQIVKIMRIQADQRGLSFVYDHDPELPLWIQGDEQRLREVLINLLGNAIKFTDDGQVTFRVKMCNGILTSDNSRDNPPQNPSSLTASLRFEVEDTGVGIAPEKFEDIFLPFQQGEFQRSAKEGTGLGLTISRKFVEMMGGSLHVSSKIGRGSLFAFELAFPEVHKKLPVKSPLEPKIVGYQGQRRTILVADDRQGNRAVLVERLSSLGFEVLEAEHGQECLDLALAYVPQVILLDLQMPILNGFEVARRVRACPELHDVIVIAVSASVYEEVRVQSLQAGCHEFLSKPIQFQTLLDYLRQYLQLEWSYQEPPLKSPPEEQEGEETSLQSDLFPVSVRESLIELAKLGMARQLLAELDDLDVQDKKFQPLTAHLRQFVKNYQFEQVLECLGH